MTDQKTQMTDAAMHADTVLCSEGCAANPKVLDALISQTQTDGGILATEEGFPPTVMFTVTQGPSSPNGKPTWLDRKIFSSGSKLLSPFKDAYKVLMDTFTRSTRCGTATRCILSWHGLGP